MVGVPRSQRLLGFESSGPGYSPGFVCPANHVVLVKHIYLSHIDPTTAKVFVYLSIPNVAAGLVLLRTDIATETEIHWEGWAVMHPGEQLAVHVDIAGTSLAVYGAILQGPPLFPPAEFADPLIAPPPLGFLT